MIKNFVFSFFLLLTVGSAFRARAEIKLTDAWSDDKDHAAALKTLTASLKKKGAHDPKLIVTYFTENYEPQTIIAALAAEFPNSQIYGQTVYMGVFTSEGLHVSRNGSIAALSFEGTGFTVGESGAEIDAGTDVTDLSANLSKQAIASAKKKDSDPVSLILLSAKKGNEEAVLKGAAQAFPKDSAMIGGTPSTNSFGGGVVIVNKTFYRHGMGVAALYSDHKVGSAFYSGVATSVKSGKVTEVNGRVLMKIDGKPAQDVYKAWAHGRFDGFKPKTDDIATMETATAPLFKKLKLANGQETIVTIRPQKFMKNGGLTIGADVAVGDDLFFADADKALFVQRAGETMSRAEKAAGMASGNVAGGLQIYCAGSSTVIGLQPGEAGADMVKTITTAMNGKPFIGGFTSAEQGDVKGFGFLNANLMSSAAVLEK